jgi:hypothetical protein
MKKFILLGLLAAVSQLWAANRTLKQANDVAQQLLDKPQIVKVDNSSFYVYNDLDQKGFVIVSGSDKLRPVIGYSENGTFSEEAMPDNMRDFLRWVDETTTFLESHPECVLTKEQLAANVQVVSPLLGNIQWNQTDPFNRLCPTDSKGRSVTGCVATAGAQVVYHYRYPDKGIGSHTDANNRSLTVNFAQQTYNYDLMFPRYTNTQSEAQLNEVAKLSYHCGVMSDMAYSSDASAAQVSALQAGLVQNMGYDPYSQTLFRQCYNFEDWRQILQTELNENRPIIYSGYSRETDTGHCFVVDGINSDGLYHVNWGWGGYLDGYFDIMILNPDGYSTGGTANSDGYSSEQQAIIQLAPKGTLTNPTYYTSMMAPYGEFTIHTSGPVTIGNTFTFSLSQVFNYSGYETMRGNIGLAFCQNGKVVQYTLFSRYALDLGPNYGYPSLDNLQVQLPRSLRAGTYQVYPCVVPTSGTFENYCGIVRTCGLLPQYYTCTIQSNKGTFVRSDDRLGVLEASEWSIADRTVTANRTQRFTGKVTNKSDYTVSGRYTLQLISPEGDTATVQNKTVLTLAPEESGQLTFDYNFRKKGVWTGKLYIAHQGFEGYLETDLTPVEGSEFPIYVGVAVVGIEEIVATDSTPVPTYNTMGQRVAEDRIEKSELYIRDGKKAIAF